LAKMIDEQVDRWGAYARRAHMPMGRHGSIAKQIHDDSQPLEHEPINYMEQAGFGGDMTREEAKLRMAYERRRQVLSKWALLETLDDRRAQNEGLVDFMDIIKNSTEHPGVPDEYRFAIRALRRLYIVREQLATKIGRVSTLDVSPYAQITVAIGEDVS